MKTTPKVILVAFLLSLIPNLAHAQQYTLGQTTLSAKAGAGDTQIQVASATGINGYNANLQPIISSSTTPQSDCYIDRELVEIRSISGTVAQVRRGINGTTGTAHASGAMVLCGPAVAWYTYDPGGTPTVQGVEAGGACTTANTLVTPWVNVRSGAQWLCSTITSTWVPGFGNPGVGIPNTAVASGTAAMVPSGTLFHVTGTSAMTSVVIPVGCNATTVGSCQFTGLCDSTASWSAGNNIADSITCVQYSAVTFVWDPGTSKFILLQSYGNQ